MKLVIGTVALEYSVEGPRTGVPVVFIHGFPFDQSMWAPQVAALKPSHYVVTYDVRGHGRSGVGDGQYTIELFVDDLLTLLDHLRIARAVIVGLSMGGYIALRAIERAPDRFRGLVLCDTRSEADSNEGKIRRATQAQFVKTQPMSSFADLLLTGLFYEKSFSERPDAVARIRSSIERTSPVAVAGTLIALAGRTDTTPSLYSIKVPTMILVGKHDTLTPVSAATAIREKVPDATMHIIPGAGHVSNLEQPERFNEHLLTFLKRFHS